MSKHLIYLKSMGISQEMCSFPANLTNLREPRVCADKSKIFFSLSFRFNSLLYPK